MQLIPLVSMLTYYKFPLKSYYTSPLHPLWTLNHNDLTAGIAGHAILEKSQTVTDKTLILNQRCHVWEAKIVSYQCLPNTETSLHIEMKAETMTSQNKSLHLTPYCVQGASSVLKPVTSVLKPV